MNLRGAWLYFFNPFAILVAITTLAVFMMHGALYLTMKTQNRLYIKMHLLANNFTIFFVISFVITTLYTLLYIPHLSDFFRASPARFLIPLLMVLTIANIPRQIKRGKYRFAFLSSAATIALVGTPLVGLYTSFQFWTFKGKVKLDEMSY